MKYARALAFAAMAGITIVTAAPATTRSNSATAAIRRKVRDSVGITFPLWG